jgi:hypothetical protein
MNDIMTHLEISLDREFALTPPEPKPFAPTADVIALLLSIEYGVSIEQAMCWCVNAFGEAP